jgi:hypothetical protein
VLAYLDASAITKLVVAEAESAALRRTLSRRAPRLVTSVVAEVEVRRAVRRAGDPVDSRTLDELFDRLVSVDLVAAIRRLAGELDPRELRSFDAVHLATALTLGPELEAFVCYDRRLTTAAEAHGLRVLAPTG